MHEQRVLGRSTQRFGGGGQRTILVLAVWGLMIGALQYYAWVHMVRPFELFQQLVQICRGHPAGPLLFIAAAALSPLMLIPAAVLGSIAGLCFGPVMGVLYTLIGCNLSAMLTYSLGRISGRGHGRMAGWIERYGPQIRQNSLLGVIVLRLSFLPYDPINYLIGLLRVPLPQFLLANTLGSLPGVLAIVLAGASIGDITHGLPMFNPLILGGAILLLLLSLGLALLLRRAALLPARSLHRPVVGVHDDR